MLAARTFHEPAARQNSRFGKRLDREIYVASEASATALRSYAPQSNFSAPWRVGPPWTPGTEMLSSQPRLPVATVLPRPFAATRESPPGQLISGGLSS